MGRWPSLPSVCRTGIGVQVTKPMLVGIGFVAAEAYSERVAS